MSLAAKIALTPLLVWQAVRTRKHLPRLPEAEGKRSGVVGRGRKLHLLVTGDSSAAGVGVDQQSQALAEPLARRLADKLGRRVHWQLVAQSGLNTQQTLDLMRSHCVRTDVAVVVTGVNDVIEQLPSQRAVQHREAVAAWLRHHAGAQHVAFLPLPPVHAFRGLPQPLRWVVGADAKRHNAALKRWAMSQSEGISLVGVEVPMNRGMLARDGFHPGEKAYRYVANSVANHLARHL